MTRGMMGLRNRGCLFIKIISLLYTSILTCRASNTRVILLVLDAGVGQRRSVSATANMLAEKEGIALVARSYQKPPADIDGGELEPVHISSAMVPVWYQRHRKRTRC